MNKGKGGYELTGELIQGYKISKPIGQGKFSIVYRAENEQGIPFALKKINVFCIVPRYLIWLINVKEKNVYERYS